MNSVVGSEPVNTSKWTWLSWICVTVQRTKSDPLDWSGSLIEAVRRTARPDLPRVEAVGDVI